MPRMTRADSQAQTRALLLASARKLFLRDGYNATGIAAVTEHAGFSSGAFYSNFPSKAALALEVLQEIQTERTKELETILRSRAADIGARIDSWSEEVLRSGWPLLELEFALAVRGDHEFVQQEGGRHVQSVAFITKAMEDFLPPELVELMPVNQVAEAVMNLVVGVAVRRIIDPKVSFAPLSELASLVSPFVGADGTAAADSSSTGVIDLGSR
ncbi:transcriptional regulator, TetR family [Segniliparus rotundus DSM 44985]|uniref:Transcriptional regulator, TetR family n=1 Tax=Segniliparus rotundus (strain ATCC BAA-972 / CDC 1076 / CIP 108378 / DSM 44985 / JCM 13578) TaxID=640132 RepID=D6Z850_SEGRD|nr:TetR/AcrR family transcriptional regulator [Segniliparus rotundus]ADG98130.1 transcriptional regulator, TetR family [Segniliparus rotundus DSM 44985]